MTQGSDVIVTGLPRAGSTLVSALIDGLPQCVSFNAPPWQLSRALKMRDALPFGKWLVGDFLWQRTLLLQQKPVRDHRAPDGSHLLDGMRDSKQVREESGEASLFEFIRPGLEPGFTLAMKHTELYSCTLPALLDFAHFKVIAVIRNPLDVITSWQSLAGQPIAKAQMALAEPYWPQAAQIIASGDDLTTRMVQLYELHLERYHALRDKIHILKYEDVAHDPMIVSHLMGSEGLPAAALRITQPQNIRANAVVAPIRERLRRYGTVTKFYYPDI